jgi:hypothetical protein
MPHRTHGETESILANVHAAMKNHAVTDQRMLDNRLRTDIAVPSDLDVVGDNSACANH